jgi:hypothetical protein
MRIVMMIVGLGMSTALNAAAPTFRYLECTFDKTSIVVGFTQQPPQVIDALSPNVPMVSPKVTEQEISAGSDNPFHSHQIYTAWHPNAEVKDASSMYLIINRLTGQIRVDFMKAYGVKEKAQCRAKTPNSTAPWCNYPPVSETRYGTCRKVVRRF